jgi:hypothetical protein
LTRGLPSYDFDERIAFVRFIEIDFSGNRRNAETVSVVRNTRNYAAEESAHFRGREFPKAQRVQAADWPSAHRENVPNDPADTGRRALKRLDGARMIVRLDLESDRQSIANVNDAGVFFASADEDAGGFGGKSFEKRTRVLIGTMLAPHHREDAQLRVVRLAAQNAFDALILLGGEAVLLDQFGCNGLLRHVSEMIIRSATLSKMDSLCMHGDRMA